MKAKEYEATITQKGQITLPSALRKANNWNKGSKLIFKVVDDQVIVSKKKNLYETSFGDYDFQKDAHSDPELSELYTIGKEGWGFEDEE